LSAINYGEFTYKVHQRIKDRVPIDVTLELTHRCPLTCAHCYNNLPMSDRAAASSELSLEEYKRLLDELHDMGTFWVLFSGGEPFARKDFLDIYTYAKQKGFLITVFTNGTVLTPVMADYLAEWPPFAIEITLYGRTKETYEKLTGQAGSFDRCMRGIQLLLERKLPLKLKTVPTSINKHEVHEMQRFAEELGVEFKYDALINPRTDCSQSPLGVRLRPEEVVALEFSDAKRAAEYRKLLETSIAQGPPPASEDVYFCGGGMTSCAVDPYGNMSICVISHQDHYNLRQGSFTEGWNQALLRVRNKKRIYAPSKCSKCQIHSVCSMCPANGELENGDPESPVEFLCEVAHLRAMALRIHVPEHGDCDYCSGGARYEDLQVLKQNLPLIHETMLIPTMALPVLNTESSGCQARCGR
jgi:radical SAM protein with 4Fe4S-binding SPASM domain